MADGAQPFAVNPVEAIEFLRKKVNVPTRTWTDIWQGQHSAAFVVAGAQSDALLADFHEAVNRNIAEGRTLEQFRADFDQIVARHGWSYKGSRNWRSRVIFNTNLRMAYSAGKWDQFQRLKKMRPYLRYVAVMDDRTRPLHAHWHNTILPVDHPWWDTHIPPNGWNCRCMVQSLSERDLKRYGFKVTETPPPIEMEPREINTSSGKVVIQVPKGIDPGFAYNPGKAGFGGAGGPGGLAQVKHGDQWPRLVAPGEPDDITLPPLPIDKPIARPLPEQRGISEEMVRRALRASLGGRDEAVLVDPASGRVLVGQSLLDHIFQRPVERLDGRERYFPLIPELIENPAEIWLGWTVDPATGRVTLRRRYVKLVTTEGGGSLGLVADADGGMYSGLTFYFGKISPRAGLRWGLLVYRRGG